MVKFEKNLGTTVFGLSRSSSYSQKYKVIGQGQGHLKEKYSDSNSSNDFAQNQHADCPWHADFDDHDHFFPGQTVLP